MTDKPKSSKAQVEANKRWRHKNREEYNRKHAERMRKYRAKLKAEKDNER